MTFVSIRRLQVPLVIELVAANFFTSMIASYGRFVLCISNKLIMIEQRMLA